MAAAVKPAVAVVELSPTAAFQAAWVNPRVPVVAVLSAFASILRLMGVPAETAVAVFPAALSVAACVNPAVIAVVVWTFIVQYIAAVIPAVTGVLVSPQAVRKPLAVLAGVTASDAIPLAEP